MPGQHHGKGQQEASLGRAWQNEKNCPFRVKGFNRINLTKKTRNPKQLQESKTKKICIPCSSLSDPGTSLTQKEG
jgi:hypothetical protein